MRRTLQRWQQNGLAGLWDAPGRGAKAKWQEADLLYLEQCLEQRPRTYNSQQLAQKLKQERQLNLSADRIRRVLKKRALVGNGLDSANEADKTPLQSP